MCFWYCSYSGVQTGTFLYGEGTGSRFFYEVYVGTCFYGVATTTGTKATEKAVENILSTGNCVDCVETTRNSYWE